MARRFSLVSISQFISSSAILLACSGGGAEPTMIDSNCPGLGPPCTSVGGTTTLALLTDYRAELALAGLAL